MAVVLDSLKQHYFLDRDGRMFRHILNYVRHGRLMVPKKFDEWPLLYEEAKWFAVPGMAQEIEDYMDRKPLTDSEDDDNAPHSRKRRRFNSPNNGLPRIISSPIVIDKADTCQYSYECIIVTVTPDLGERITLTAERTLTEEVFPEISGVGNGMNHLGMNSDPQFLTQFPLNGYCKLNSTQVIQRLLGAGFAINASTGGGIDAQHITQYLFVRKNPLVT